MTKFGWLVVLGILAVVGSAAVGTYLIESMPHPEREQPERIQEVVLPPSPSDTASSTVEVEATTTRATSTRP